MHIGSVINCACECVTMIAPYLICDSTTKPLMRRSNVWISYFNVTNYTTSGYLLCPNCPYDYCNPLSVPIDLNRADTQCAYNRSGLLCGSCRPGLSLSLGTTHCLLCPRLWPVIFISISIAALLAGVVLVAVLMALNMTVAVGTLNGLIFYVNVVAVNRSILLPFKEQSFISIFISWLNLDLGIETCYFPGLDAYTKIWIQLGFVAAYVILLITFIMIVVSSYSSRFTNLIGKKNPVATLSTLVFLSYTKLLEVIFTAMSFSSINYPDGSVHYAWLPDASVKYLVGKHIILFIVAVLLFQVGLVYTILLFSWQWLLCLPSSWKIFNWTRNHKLHTFIETYNAPYVAKHRYWTGMLLVVRAILYLTAAFNASHDPQVTLVSIIFTMGCILLLKGIVGRLYQKWLIDILETFFYFNLLALALFVWYFLDKKKGYYFIAYISVIITLILLLIIILYHVYTYTAALSIATKLGHRISFMKLIHSYMKSEPKHQSPPPDELLDIIDRPFSSDYKQLLREKPTKSTYPVPEINMQDLSATTTDSSGHKNEHSRVTIQEC